MQRETLLEKLKSERFNLLVIGGGATGAGIALDAATRGLRVALVERDDFASGTSSRSTKLIHGGVRYLEQAVKKLDRGQWNLVRDALHERATLLKLAPHLARPLSLVTPLYNRISIPYYRIGLKLYDRLAGRSNLQPSRYLSAREALENFPMLKAKGLRGGVLYYDGQFDDARMNVSLAMTAVEQGAVALNHIEVVELLKQADRLQGAVVRERFCGEEFTVHAEMVVNAAGPFCDQVRQMDDPACPPLLKASSGVHIVLDKRFSPQSTGLLIPKTEDGRVLFLLPWLGHTLVGTTDNPAEIEKNPKPTVADIDYILRHIERYFDMPVSRKDVLSAWSGLRPLVSHPKTADTAGLSRDHVIHVSDSRLLTITGGKWTTYRKMALDAVDHAVKIAGLPALGPSRSEVVPLRGAEGYSEALPEQLVRRFGLNEDIARHLAKAYGSKAAEIAELAGEGWEHRLAAPHPYLEAEVIYAIRQELGTTATDVLARRMRLAFLDIAAARNALPRTVEIMGQELGWDIKRQHEEIQNFEEYLTALPEEASQAI
ncbi:MAG TPA: glycerol-3-phosphate dehydrogenase [Deltaproteobacteria bacterium]|nr:glycerol-3-phosphate dehydrogenase [Deltaproteobacteria bacterium]